MSYRHSPDDRVSGFAKLRIDERDVLITDAPLLPLCDRVESDRVIEIGVGFQYVAAQSQALQEWGLIIAEELGHYIELVIDLREFNSRRKIAAAGSSANREHVDAAQHLFRRCRSILSVELL